MSYIFGLYTNIFTFLTRTLRILLGRRFPSRSPSACSRTEAAFSSHSLPSQSPPSAIIITDWAAHVSASLEQTRMPRSSAPPRYQVPAPPRFTTQCPTSRSKPTPKYQMSNPSTLPISGNTIFALRAINHPVSRLNTSKAAELASWRTRKDTSTFEPSPLRKEAPQPQDSPSSAISTTSNGSSLVFLTPASTLGASNPGSPIRSAESHLYGEQNTMRTNDYCGLGLDVMLCRPLGSHLSTVSPTPFRKIRCASDAMKFKAHLPSFENEAEIRSYAIQSFMSVPAPVARNVAFQDLALVASACTEHRA
jgi:hypothetical protein